MTIKAKEIKQLETLNDVAITADSKISLQSLRESVIYFALLFCAVASIATTLGIVYTLAGGAIDFFKEVSVVEFFTGFEWTPLFKPARFGILPLLSGTLLTTFGACLIAIPIGSATAIFLSEYASPRTRKLLKPTLELLAGIPTVVYGYFALIAITPLMQKIFPGVSVFNAASASIVMGIMIIPMVSSLSEDALVAVPRSLREAAYGLGSTKLEVVRRVVVPAARSGIMASYILAISRAIGETMIVMLAAGSTPKMTLNPFEGIQTMTAYIAQVSLGDTPTGSIEFKTLFAVGAMLLLLTTLINIAGQRIVRKKVAK